MRLAFRWEDPILDWVKITAVPLAVFQIGTCIWGIIVDTRASWSSSNEIGGGLPDAEEMPAHSQANSGFLPQGKRI